MIHYVHGRPTKKITGRGGHVMYYEISIGDRDYRIRQLNSNEWITCELVYIAGNAIESWMTTLKSLKASIQYLEDQTDGEVATPHVSQ